MVTRAPGSRDSFVSEKLVLLVNVPPCLDLVKEAENTQQTVLKRKGCQCGLGEGGQTEI